MKVDEEKSDMKQRTWWCLIPDRAKTHFVPEELKERLIQNLSDRGHEDQILEAIAEGGVCRGGARLVNDSIMDFELPGLVFRLYAADVEFYLTNIRNAKERLEFGTPYYKIHGDIHCVCLLPSDRELLIRLMEERLEEANAIRDVEFQAFNEAMQNIDCSYIDPGAPRKHRAIEDV